MRSGRARLLLQAGARPFWPAGGAVDPLTFAVAFALGILVGLALDRWILDVLVDDLRALVASGRRGG